MRLAHLLELTLGHLKPSALHVRLVTHMQVDSYVVHWRIRVLPISAPETIRLAKSQPEVKHCSAAFL